ncbi:MAG: fibronectin type III domain-containing protein [Dysgonomonas sp.]
MKKYIFTKSILVIIALISGSNISFATTVTAKPFGSDGYIDDNISYTTQQNSSSSAPVYILSDKTLRLAYDPSGNGDGSSVSLIPSNGVVIKEVKITTYSAYYTPSVSYSVDGGADLAATLSSTTYTISDISAASVLKIKNVNTAILDLRIIKFEVTYEEAPALVAPVATEASSISSSGFVANWNEVPDASGYELNVYTKSDDVTNPIDGSPFAVTGSTSKELSGLSPQTTYYYTVVAKSGDATSPLSNEISVITSSSAATSIYTFAGASGRINDHITYTTQKNSSGNPVVFSLSDNTLVLSYHSSGNGNSITLIPVGVVIKGVKITSIDESYTPTVKYNVDGGSDVTADLSSNVYTISNISATSILKIRNANTTNLQLRLTTIEVTYQNILDAPVATEASSISSSGFVANWDEVLDAVGYELNVYTKNDDVTNPIDGSPFAITGSTSKELSGLSPQTTYYYTVIAKGGDINSLTSNEITVVTNATTGIENSVGSIPKIYTQNGRLIISDAINQTIEIFNPLGQKITTFKTTEGINTFEIPVHGIILVKIGNSINKVIL